MSTLIVLLPDQIIDGSVLINNLCMIIVCKINIVIKITFAILNFIYCSKIIYNTWVNIYIRNDKTIFLMFSTPFDFNMY